MSPIQNIYYALGEVIYAISKANGTSQKKEKLKNILVEEFNKQLLDFDPSAIIFHILAKESMEATTAFNWAIKEIKLNSHYVSEKMKKQFIHILQRVSQEFPPVTTKEQLLIDSFISEIKIIKGDSVFTKEFS